MSARAYLTALRLIALSWIALVTPAAASEEQIESDISSRDIAIESNFTGRQIVVFGTIENSQQSEFEPGLYDLVVVIRGPRETIVARRKSRIAGIWINRDSQTFATVPGFYAVLSDRPLRDIANEAVLKAFELGFENLDLRLLDSAETKPGDAELAAYRAAIIRIKQSEGLYYYNPKGVTFVGRNLFRATIDLPSNVPVGLYASDVYLLREKEVLSHNRSQLKIGKQGFERFVFSAAFDYPVLYGIIAVIIAIAAGLLASALSRRD